MCKTFYKYFLITATSFGSCGGLYLFVLTKWLWPYPIFFKQSEEWRDWDWRVVPIYSGLVGFLIFTPGIVIVIRAQSKELKPYGIFLIIPLICTIVGFGLQMSRNVNLFDETDWYLLGLAIGILAIIVNLFLLKHEIDSYGNHQLISGTKFTEENAV